MESITALNKERLQTLKSLICGSGPSFLPIQICIDIRKAVEFLKHEEFDINNPEIQSFLKFTLPKLTEVLIKRQTTLLEHEQFIFATILVVVGFLALPVCQESSHLCELRNIMLNERLYATTFLLLAVEELPESSHRADYAEGLRLFNDCGLPREILTELGVRAFWQDEWQDIFGGDQAVGCSLDLFVTEGDQADARWLAVEVISFSASDHTHRVLIRTLVPGFTASEAEGAGAAEVAKESEEPKRSVVEGSADRRPCSQIGPAVKVVRVNTESSEGGQYFDIDLSTTVHRWKSSTIETRAPEGGKNVFDEEKLHPPPGSAFASASASNHRQLAQRPAASSVRSSHYPGAVLNEFHRCSGLHLMFESLRDFACEISPMAGPGLTSPGFHSVMPDFKTILLHLKLLYRCTRATPPIHPMN